MLSALSPIACAIAHPDDEIFVAGLIAGASRAGARVHVLCATRGERGPAPRGRAQDEVAAIRTRELEASCRILGAEPPLVFEFPDGELERAGEGRLAETWAESLAAIAPRALVSFGPDGGYGHRDHIAAATAARAAAARLDPSPSVLAAAFPAGALSSISARIRSWSPGLIDPALRPEDLGRARDEAALIVDVGPVAAQKRRATSSHASQLPGGDPDRFLAPGFLASISTEEWYAHAAGPPLPDDLPRVVSPRPALC